MSSGAPPQSPPPPVPEPTPESVLGVDEFAQRALAMVGKARQEIVISSADLDRRIYGGEALVDSMRRFLLEHRRGRLRGLVADPRQAVRGAHRLVDLSRALSSRIEFRRPALDSPAGAADFLVVDQRLLLIRVDPADLEARYYADAAPMARELLREFERRWDHAEPAREFTDLRL